ncbi:FAD-dependent oxidoreductase [Stenomitos frigidus]|uniref:MnmG N-terminal domain-containing protein n=1 Tax=Stenomitos frigidus ULC18 TaxID=2107698 RepID=A0A2T1DZ03_9CYAN|nr:hypothetical protein C7B82_22560 [Stenomitos frigidus ULC18]
MTVRSSVDFLDAFDVIVLGSGHAGCEAALATARLGCRVMPFWEGWRIIGMLGSIAAWICLFQPFLLCLCLNSTTQSL